MSLPNPLRKMLRDAFPDHGLKFRRISEKEFDNTWQPYNMEAQARTKKEIKQVGEDVWREIKKGERRERTARTRRVNKAIKEAGFDPKVFRKLADKHRTATPEEFRRLLEGDHNE